MTVAGPITIASLREGLRRLAAVALALALFADPVLAAGPASNRSPAPADSQERVVHALDRLTFGPRPGEVAAVQRMGLSKWFELQLRPETIDDSALETRLAQFPAMALPQEQLLAEFPSPQMLRQRIATDEPLPTDPLERALSADYIAFYKAAKARKEATQAGTPSAATTGDGSDAGEAGVQHGTVRKGTGQAGVPVGMTEGTPDAASGLSDEPVATEGNPELSGKGRLRHAERIFPEAETLRLLQLAPEARVRQILSMPPEELIRFRKSLSDAELTGMAAGLSPRQMEMFASLRGPSRLIAAEAMESRLERDVYSERQLQAVMTDFWLNHFNVYVRKNQSEPLLLPAYERDTIRPHALGRFEDLLQATAKSPAMLIYLDNWQSAGPASQAALRTRKRTADSVGTEQAKAAKRERGLNENYARELMELHTLGVRCEVSKDRSAGELDKSCGTGYTQADVTAVAKVFSGWTVNGPNLGGTYRFDERRHEPGAKTVLGKTIAEAGEDEGREVLHLLASSPATAQFLSTELAVRFVSDTPPAALVASMTRAYLASDGEIAAVLRAMFQSPDFWSPEVLRAKVKTPLEFVTSALRATDAEVSDPQPLVKALDRLGMPLYGMPTPNGYSWTAETWVSTGELVGRMNVAIALSGNQMQGTRVDWSRLLGQAPRPLTQPVPPLPAEKVAAEEGRLELLLLGARAGTRTRAAVLAQAEEPAAGGPARTAAGADFEESEPVSASAMMGGLLLGSPEFQRH